MGGWVGGRGPEDGGVSRASTHSRCYGADCAVGSTQWAEPPQYLPAVSWAGTGGAAPPPYRTPPNPDRYPVGVPSRRGGEVGLGGVSRGWASAQMTETFSKNDVNERQRASMGRCDGDFLKRCTSSQSLDTSTTSTKLLSTPTSQPRTLIEVMIDVH